MPNALFVTEQEFSALPTYQISDPTGTISHGKLMKFKRRYPWGWRMLEYVDIGKPDRVGIRYVPLIVYDADWGQ